MGYRKLLQHAFEFASVKHRSRARDRLRLRPALALALLALSFHSALGQPTTEAHAPRTFSAQGVVTALRPDRGIAVIRHQSIAGYMPGMTMPFRVADSNELARLRVGEQIAFKLHVSADRSWIDGIRLIGFAPVAANARPAHPRRALPPMPSRQALLDYKFTNELGQAVSLNDFRGQALALTFFFTRCPIPEYCPRLSKNFQEASRKLEAMAGAPTNWHFISVSFDPQSDTPAVLRAYAQSYHADESRWNFLTGPPDKIGALARACGVNWQPDGNFFTHNFRTLIVDAAGHLQTTFPMGGDLSDAIVSEMLKAARATPVEAAAAGAK